MAQGHRKERIIRYGRWQDGRRLQWFKIDQSKSLDNQLKQIEEQVQAEEVTNKESEAAFLQFHPPQQFFERLANVMVETNKIKQILVMLKEVGISKQDQVVER